jgi:hypothetical protein
MISKDISPELQRLVHLVVKTMIERTKSDLQVPIGFTQAYEQACNKDTNNKYDYSNLEILQHVRDILLRNGYIFVNPDEAEEVFITKKAIDQYESLPQGDC